VQAFLKLQFQGGRGGFSRAYMHHLDRCGEMLGPMLATISRVG
jgi:hypothetical protein